jgi:hypothetical protein
VLAGFLRQRHYVRENVGLVVGEKLAAVQPVLARTRLRHHAHREHHDIQLAGIGFLEDTLQVLQAMRIPHGHQNAARPHAQGGRRKIRARVQPELLLILLMGSFALSIVNVR